ncbi:hypothetical protein H0W91_00365 [Patescibacteria group bacterium]|nr:hypothetical protein [Patescibacteria group bacterium]
MEDLNKNQLVLLVLLISFVTSIATGIITVSLLQEAPLEVTRNINRIVEKTIETVTPATPTTTVTTSNNKVTTTVVLKEEDLILDSIKKNINSIVRIKEKDGGNFTTRTYGIGLVVTKEGIIAADRNGDTTGNGYIGITNDGTELPLTPVGENKSTTFILFRAGQEKSPKGPYVFVPAVITEIPPKLGQTIIGLGGLVTNSVSVGRIVSLDMKESGIGSTTVEYLSSIDTDLPSKDLIHGSPLFDLSGNVVGIKTTGEGLKAFTFSAILKKEISILLN